jgi:hypothetical protein
LRYLYANGILYDFESGIEAGVRIIPYVSDDGSFVDEMGSLIYLSERTFHSLIGQLYLMDDPEGLYPGVTLAHVEDTQVVKALNSYYPGMSNFVYHRGLQGPIKIWKINISDDILVRDEFFSTSGGYGTFDNLQFTK